MKLKRGKSFLGKKGVEVELIIWWAVALIIAVIFAGIMIYNKGSMSGAIEKIKNLFTFGR